MRVYQILALVLALALQSAGVVRASELDVVLAQAVIPPAVVRPTIDGDGTDLAWRAPSARLPPFQRQRPGDRAQDTDATRAWITCDANTLYLLVRCQRPQSLSGANPGQLADAVTVQFGPSPWQQRRLRLCPDGALSAEVWSGWEWRPLWHTRAQARTHETAAQWQAEIALPRGEICAEAPRQGAHCHLRLSRLRPGGNVDRLTLDQGLGVMLGVTTAATRLRRNSHGFTLELLHWDPGVNSLRVMLSLPYVASGRTVWRTMEQTVTALKTGRTRHDLPLPEAWPDASPSYAPLVLTIHRPKQPAESHTIWPPMPDRDVDWLASLLEQAQALPASDMARGLLADAAQHLAANDQAGAAACLAWAFPRRHDAGPSKLEQACCQESTLLLHDSAPAWSTTLKRRFAHDAEADWEGLRRLAQSNAAARAAYRQAHTLGALQNQLLEAHVHPQPGLAKKLAIAFQAWRRSRPLPSVSDGCADPAWHPDVAVLRLRVLTALAAGPLRSEDGRSALLPCLAEAARTDRFLLEQIECDQGATPWRPDLALQVAAARERLGFGALGRAELQHLAHLVLASHLNPDGTGRLPGTYELLALRSLRLLQTWPRPLQPKPAPAGWNLSAQAAADTDAPPGWLSSRTDIKRLLLYLAERVLPSARLPYFLGTPRRVLETDLADWAATLFPQIPDLQRFLPEGLVAAPLIRSAPNRSHASEYGGLYVLRAPRRRFAAAIYAPPAFATTRGHASRVYGALLLTSGDQDLLVEPRLPASGWLAPVTVNDLGPHPASLPVPGTPLPHHWITGPDWDYLAVAWQILPMTRSASRVTRHVFLAKGEHPYLYIVDALAFDAPPAGSRTLRLTQRFPLHDVDASHFTLTPIDAADVRTVTTKKDEQSVLRVQRVLPLHATSELIFRPLPEPAPGGAPPTSTPLPAPARLGKKHAEGGGVIRIPVSKKATDFLLLTPNGEGLDGLYGPHRVQFHGTLARLRLDATGMRSIDCVHTRSVSFQRQATWQIRFSEPVDAAIAIRPDGSYAARLESQHAKPVTITVRLEPADKTRVRQATADLLPGRSVVFRLL